MSANCFPIHLHLRCFNRRSPCPADAPVSPFYGSSAGGGHYDHDDHTPPTTPPSSGPSSPNLSPSSSKGASPVLDCRDRVQRQSTYKGKHRAVPWSSEEHIPASRCTSPPPPPTSATRLTSVPPPPRGAAPQYSPYRPRPTSAPAGFEPLPSLITSADELNDSVDSFIDRRRASAAVGLGISGGSNAGGDGSSLSGRRGVVAKGSMPGSGSATEPWDWGEEEHPWYPGLPIKEHSQWAYIIGCSSPPPTSRSSLRSTTPQSALALLPASSTCASAPTPTGPSPSAPKKRSIALRLRKASSSSLESTGSGPSAASSCSCACSCSYPCSYPCTYPCPGRRKGGKPDLAVRVRKTSSTSVSGSASESDPGEPPEFSPALLARLTNKRPSLVPEEAEDEL